MQIHVVKQGQTLRSIAESYNTTVQSLINANKIPAPYNLAVGQTLVIPIIGQYHIIEPGDTLYKIAQQYGISIERLTLINGISLNTILNIGDRLYIPPLPKRQTEMNAYLEPFGDEVQPNLIEQFQIAAPRLTYIGPFSFRIEPDGTLAPPPLDNIAEIARMYRVIQMLVVTNLVEGQFSQQLGKELLTNEELQDTLINNIVDTAKELNFREIHFDLEFLPPEERENYVAFLRKAKSRFENEGFLMSVALAPKTSAEQKGAWYEAHDYKAIGEIADFVVLMTYEWGYSGGPPLPVSPINEVQKVIDYAVSVMPPSKIMLGQNLYGYDWKLPYTPGGEFAKALSPQQAIQIAIEQNVPILYDEEAQAPFFEYTDDDGTEHIVWFEDARSIQAKFNLIKRMNLRGASYWKLGLEFPQVWLLIDDNFNVIKRA